jgi:Spy/CpxP family protein refolding chaperone
MSGTTKRIVLGLGVLGLGAAAIAVALAGVAYAAGQNNSPAQVQGTGPGAPGRFGGPGGPGGPFGRGGRGGPGGPGGPMGILGPMMIERLDLTTDQRDRVKQILESHREEQQAIGQRGMAARTALEAAITADTFDESAIRARAADVGAIEADVTVVRARVYAEVFQILTSDQQAKLKALQTEMRQRGEQMRANRQQRGAQKH